MENRGSDKHHAEAIEARDRMLEGVIEIGLPFRDSLAARIEYAIRAHTPSIAAFSAASGLSRQTVYRWIKTADETPPSRESLATVARFTGVRLDWLVTGEGLPFIVEVENPIRITRTGDVQPIMLDALPSGYPPRLTREMEDLVYRWKRENWTNRAINAASRIIANFMTGALASRAMIVDEDLAEAAELREDEMDLLFGAAVARAEALCGPDYVPLAERLADTNIQDRDQRYVRNVTVHQMHYQRVGTRPSEVTCSCEQFQQERWCPGVEEFQDQEVGPAERAVEPQPKIAK